MRNVLARENEVYQAVLNGELMIDVQGRIWRVAARRGGRGRPVMTFPCQPRRAEHWTPQGYLQVRVMFDGKRIYAEAHRLVYLHFKGQIPPGLTVNHRNGRKWSNHPDNLESATYSEQQIHALYVLHRGRTDQNGTKNSMARLTTVQVQEIRYRRATGEKLASIAVDYGVRYQHISRIARGDRRLLG